jgi:hypothetical protein
MDLPLPLLDREIAGAAGRLRAAKERLAEGGSTQNPLWNDRRVSTRTTYQELAEQPASPLAEAARRWVYALTLERVLWPDTVRLAEAWRASTAEIEVPEPLRTSPRDLLHRVLAERDGQRRRAWAEGLENHAGGVAEAARIQADRRVEAARRLETAPDAMEIPFATPGAVAIAAGKLLQQTAAVVEVHAESWDEAFASSLARSASAGWPAHLSPRWIEGLFHATGLTAGLRPALPRLPAALGATSFARALSAFGAALADADGPPSAPFSLARPPFDLRRARRAALFGSLVADPVFCFRALGLGRDRALDQARTVAKALLVGLRVDAARVLLRGSLLLPERDRGHLLEETTAAALGAPIPPPLAGVIPALRAEDPVTFAGTLLAALDRRALIGRFDEDWFRNPRAAEALREEDAVLPASPSPPAEVLDAGLRALVEALGELL